MPFMRAALAVFLCLVAASGASAEISLSPLRQVFTEARRTATYRLSNPSHRLVEGRVAWIDLAATETGYAPATPDLRDRLSAAPYLLVWPAFFKLEPGAAITITVAVRDGVAIPSGERRSHLLIETGASRTPLRRAGGLQLDIGVGVSTPVILRGGKGVAKAEIADTALRRDADGLLEIATTLVPSGQFSAYGRLDAWLTPEHGERTRLARIENVAAWRDAAERRFSLPLKLDSLPAGVMELRFEGREEFDGAVFATRAFEVAPPK